MQWLHLGAASQPQGVSWPCGEKWLLANLAFALLQALTQVWQGLMLPEPCMGQLGSICLLKMFVGFCFVFFNLFFFFSFHSALTLVLHGGKLKLTFCYQTSGHLGMKAFVFFWGGGMLSRRSAVPSGLRKATSSWALARQVLSVPCHHLLLPF